MSVNKKINGVLVPVSGGVSNTPTATSSSLGVVRPDNTSIKIDENGVISSDINVPIATANIAGKVKPDNDTITINEDGVISAIMQTPTIATSSSLGIVKPDNSTITVDENGVISAAGATVPIATASTAGIIKPDGNTISIDGNGTIAVSSVNWNNINNKPSISHELLTQQFTQSGLSLSSTQYDMDVHFTDIAISGYTLLGVVEAYVGYNYLAVRGVYISSKNHIRVWIHCSQNAVYINAGVGSPITLNNVSATITCLYVKQS